MNIIPYGLGEVKTVIILTLKLQKCRTLVRPEFKREEGFNGFYVCAVDVARFEGDQTVAEVFKVFTTGERYKIHLVNIKLLNGNSLQTKLRWLNN